MIYLESIKILNDMEEGYIDDPRRIHNNRYPLGIFPLKKLTDISFDNVTIFYGGNGSGKSTLLNIISDKLDSKTKTKYDRGIFFSSYVNRVQIEINKNNLLDINTVTSDDVFDYLLSMRSINSTIHTRKEDLKNEWLSNKFNSELNPKDYDRLKGIVEARKLTMSEYTRRRLVNNNIISQSNGESALMFWQQEIRENGIYILDEPENSLSAENQIRLKEFIEESVRFYNCQIILATHSPFLLSIKDAKVYDLDEVPAKVKDWTKLSNVQLYYNFFKNLELE